MSSRIELSSAEQQQLQQWARAHGTPQQVVMRCCQIVLANAQGHSDVAIAEQLSINRNTVILWRTRFSEQRLEAVWTIAPGRGRKPTYDSDKIAAIVDGCGSFPPKIIM
jgi:transposase